MHINTLFNAMWQDYLAINPDASTIHDLLEMEGGAVLNDHIALRTFDLDPVRIDRMASPFVQAGYRERGAYRFENKHLVANHFEHPDERMPKIFISAFDVESLNPDNRLLVERLVAGVDDKLVIIIHHQRRSVETFPY